MDIFVGSISFKMTEKQLVELFEQFGKVESAKIIIDKHTRQNKGFAFVTMPVYEEALKAINSLNGSEVMERTIVVNESIPKKTTHDSYFKRKVSSRPRN